MSVAFDLPPAVVRALRWARTALLYAASPLERALSPATRALPPLWLRRHAGPVARFASAALDAERLLVELGLVRPDARVVDLGCGPGAMAPVFARRLGPAGRYLGLDVHAPSIRWCGARWADDVRFEFRVLERDSPYGATCGRSGGALPGENGSVDLVLAKSLFTHTLEEESAGLLAEIGRLLRPGRGRAFVTAFLFDGSSGAEGAPYFPWPEPGAAVRWHRRRWPHAAVAYERGRFERLVAAGGLRCERFVAGFHPGRDVPPRGQDVLVLAHAENRSAT